MLALGIETESEETRKDMMKRLEGEKIRTALANMRAAGIRSFGFFILGYPGETPRRSIARSTTRSISIRTSPISIRRCRTPARSSTPRPSATACWSAKTGRAWSIRTTCCAGNGLDRADRHGRDQPRQAPLLPAPGVPGAPRRRRRAADVDQVERRLARRVARALRRAGHRRGRPASRAGGQRAA